MTKYLLPGIGLALVASAIAITASAGSSGSEILTDDDGNEVDVSLTSWYNGKPYYNNPGNIKATSDQWLGEVPSDNPTFTSFSDISYGFRAMIKLLWTYYNKYGINTLRKAIERWSLDTPSAENAYIAYVKGGMQVSETTPLKTILTTPSALRNMLFYMAKFEQGSSFTPSWKKIDEAINMIASEQLAAA